MFERFTTRARRVVVLSQEEATRLNHNYIGTQHILLALLGEQGGLAAQALTGLGMSLEGARQAVTELVGMGSTEPTGRVPFTPRAKKTLELALREALQLNHDYIGTEHLLLGILTEGERGGQDEGVAVKVLRRHAELPAVRTAVLNLLPPAKPESAPMRRWRRARTAGLAEIAAQLEPRIGQAAEQIMNATPAADVTITEAARLAGTQPVGSHHLLLASLSDPGTAAARALAALGVDLDQAKEALRGMDVTGTSDELPEEAGRRQMLVRVTGDRLTLEAHDPVLVKAGSDAIAALDDAARESGTIRGDLPVSASLSRAWQALFESLKDIQRRATSSPAAGS
ncbi:MAG TPA: Clp protease N-terminal domain-containing protein, partial [Streptosporangiaceae bacterium]|nr:Clp protease N-terminal domain-containing protein [Streptosporangiaceae bacterium]